MHRRNPSESDENVKGTDSSLLEVDGNLEESDPYLFNTDSADVEEIPVDDDALPVPPKEQKASTSPQENKKSKKRVKKLTSNKVSKSTDSVSEVEDLYPVDLSPTVSEVSGDKEGLGRRLKSSAENSLKKKVAGEKKLENEAEVVAEKAVAELQESESEFKAKSKGGKEKAKIKKMKKKESASLEDSDRNSQDQRPTENTNHHKEIKDTKKQKKKRSADKEEKELEEVFQEENPADDVFHLEAEEKIKGKKKRDSSVHEKPEGKSNKKLSRNKKSKSSSDDTPLKTTEEAVDEQPEPMEISHKEPTASTADGMSNQNEKSSKKESATVEDKDEQLGDMSFLINVNSRIALFVADASQEECELQPMTARERNDVYKVTHLYKLRARIGTKTENNLTTVRLSKQADTRMPKPGRVDSLLSELSIAASKEAVRESPKNQVKRKHSACIEGNEQTLPGDGLDQVAPPKKKLSKLSRTKKV